MKQPRFIWPLGASGLLASLLVFGCHHNTNPAESDTLPRPGSPEYAQTVSAFYTGVAALDVGDDRRSLPALQKAVSLAPGEPATWADLGLFYLRSQNMTRAASALARAEKLAPSSSAIASMLGVLNSQNGNAAAAIRYFRKAVSLDPSDIQARYSLAQEIEQEDLLDSDRQMEEQLREILKVQPDNLIALLELARLAAKTNDRAALQPPLARLEILSPGWPAEARQRFAAIEAESKQPAAPSMPLDLILLYNVLKQTAAFRASMAALRSTEKALAAPIEQFIRLPSPSPTPAAPDMKLGFTPVTAGTRADWAAAAQLSQKGPPVLLHATGQQLVLDSSPPVTMALPLGSAHAVLPQSVVEIDWSNNLNPGLCLAGAGGLRFFQQNPGNRWTDVTGQTKLPAAILSGDYTAAWAADIDLDGQLDIVLGARNGSPLVLQNNGDGTWTPVHPFAGISGLTAFTWADLTGDGAPEAALVDGSGKLAVFANNRAGFYREMPLTAAPGHVLALAAADLDRDGRLDLVTLSADGSIRRLSLPPGGSGWEMAEVARWTDAPTDGSALLFCADLDNNGAVDLVASGSRGSQVWLGGVGGKETALGAPIPARVSSIVDLDGDGRLDLVGVSPAGVPLKLMNHGSRTYGWQNILPRGFVKKGDDRNNSFGIGGRMEIRAGLLTELQPMLGPVVHFGLGTASLVNVARIVWPNGATQAEFDLKPNQTIRVPQRLTGSCPWLFAWNGHSMQFVTDILWRSPLGLKINAQDTAGVVQTRDWVKIPAGSLVARNGFYDLRITAELWETHFFDMVRLMTVDHPSGSDVFVDERFAIPPPPLKIWSTGKVIPLDSARDDAGHDVTDLLRSTDGRYLDTFGLGTYQGITRDHYVEVEPGSSVPRSGHVFLVCRGWIHPTDSSINVAISHGSHPQPQGLSLEAQDDRGIWQTVRTGIGFPAGKNKTVLIDLNGVPRPPAGHPWRLRLRTNLEIYWDSIGAAVAQPEVPVRTQVIAPCKADLRYRGFSVIHQASWSSPEIPDYEHLWGTAPRWLDLTGYYTRFGDVRQLLKQVDDRYVIMNAGDEMALQFSAPPPPPAGWTRDFVFVSDGWEKDGNLNTTFSATVLPLPSHDRPAYNTPPTTLAADPVYRRHPQDWQTFQTRYVTPDAFRAALWGSRGTGG